MGGKTRAFRDERGDLESEVGLGRYALGCFEFEWAALCFGTTAIVSD